MLVVKIFIFDFVVVFGCDCEGIVGWIFMESDYGILVFEDLYLWMRWVVDLKDDVDRLEGVFYSLGD